ncbi:hypothetical protein [Tessaracoccus sp. MC1756]|uniref:hypothetical protein n=1 Tax=Tessaracoccus sp. MC1756 TaxID=2760311 RepID=UPI001602174E|nr:hypothetical protein [Tessaracoccus sp. MC1756]MBB1510608.1 hypothetical protein [Tessaracoccus sp. MC1756]
MSQSLIQRRKISAEVQELVDQYGLYVSYPTAAKITTASERTLKRLTARGQLPCYTIGRTRVLRLRTADVVALIRRVA